MGTFENAMAEEGTREELRGAFLEARAEITRLRAINADLVEGLRPLATASNSDVPYANGRTYSVGHLTNDDFRRARELLTKVDG